MGGEDYTFEPRWRAKLSEAMYEANAIQERLALARCHEVSEGMRVGSNGVIWEQLAVESVGVVVRRGRTGSRKCLGCRRHCSSLDKWRAPAQEQEAWAPCHASQPPNTRLSLFNTFKFSAVSILNIHSLHGIVNPYLYPIPPSHA